MKDKRLVSLFVDTLEKSKGSIPCFFYIVFKDRSISKKVSEKISDGGTICLG